MKGLDEVQETKNLRNRWTLECSSIQGRVHSSSRKPKSSDPKPGNSRGIWCFSSRGSSQHLEASGKGSGPLGPLGCSGRRRVNGAWSEVLGEAFSTRTAASSGLRKLRLQLLAWEYITWQSRKMRLRAHRVDLGPRAVSWGEGVRGVPKKPRCQQLPAAATSIIQKSE